MDERLAQMTATVGRIRARAHYAVTLRPENYQGDRFNHPREMWEAVARSAVLLRGWDYPHISSRSEERICSGPHVESWSDFDEHLEYWRFTKSGQFYHIFTLWDDKPGWATKLKHWLAAKHEALEEPDGYLDVESLVWSVTEIYEFAGRLAAKGALGKRCQVTIRLANIAKRALSHYDRFMFRLYQTFDECLEWKRDHTVAELSVHPRENAVRAAQKLFSPFEYEAVPAQIEAMQRGLYGALRTGPR